MMKLRHLLPAAGLALCLSPMAFAGQHPNAEQRAALEVALTQAGFVSWGEIELEKGRWEVEDARKVIGSVEKYDLKLDSTSLEIVKQKLDD